MTRFLKPTLSVLAVLISGFSANAFEAPKLTTAELAMLNNGKAIISVWKAVEKDKKPTVSVGGIDIMTSADDVYKIMLDCSRAVEISTDIRACEVLESSEDGSWDIRKQKFTIGKFLPKIKTTFRTEYSKGPNGGHVMQVERVSGDLKIQEGRWDIIKLGPNKSRVIYQAAIKPKIPIPAKVIRKQLAIGVPDILRNLRNIAEAPPSNILQSTTTLPNKADM